MELGGQPLPFGVLRAQRRCDRISEFCGVPLDEFCGNGEPLQRLQIASMQRQGKDQFGLAQVGDRVTKLLGECPGSLLGERIRRVLQQPQRLDGVWDLSDRCPDHQPQHHVGVKPWVGTPELPHYGVGDLGGGSDRDIGPLDRAPHGISQPLGW